MNNKLFSNEDELEDLIPQFEQRGMDLETKRMQLALKAMGSPCADIPAIQVAGTNGKGSIVSFIQSSLKAAGIKAGITTSPHLISWCERIKVDGNPISLQEFKQHLISLKRIEKEYQLTPFELVLASAFAHFANQNVQLLVLEVGLGGRLDATTAHPFRPVIAMGNIGLDHCEHLGNSLKDIAKEKAAVISSGSIVISAAQQSVVTDVLEETIQTKAAQIQWVSPLSEDWNLGISGEIQRTNAAVAKGALKSLEKFGWEIDELTIKEGLALADWPGRLQLASWQEFPVVIDGAHNSPAAKQLSKERSNWKGEGMGVQWILGIQHHKQAPEMLRHLLTRTCDKAWIIPVPNHKSWTNPELSDACPELANQLLQANEVEQVFSTLLKEGPWPTPPPVVVGSLYLIGDLMKKQIIRN